VRITSSTRRTAALMAASTVGLSTLVLGATGVASAAPAFDPEISFSTDPIDEDYVDQFVAPGGDLVLPAGFCSVEWTVVGASGGDGDGPSGDAGHEGDELSGVTALDRSATTFTLLPGFQGKNGADGGAGGTNSRPADAGAAGADNSSDGVFGGGGGAASTVLKGGTAYLTAPGGAGGDGDTGGAGGAGGGTQQLQTGVTGGVGSTYGDGYISGTAYSCATAPTVNWVEGSDDTSLEFQIWDRSYLPDGDDITGLQYSVDGGSHWVTIPSGDVEVDGFQYEGYIKSLTSGTYSVTFRWATTGAPSNPSAAVTAKTLIPAPTGVSAVVGTSAVTVSWQAPAGSWGITSYTAWASPAANAGNQAGDEPPSCTTADGTTLTCTVFVPAGDAYDVYVSANGFDGMRSATLRSGVVPGPTAPTAVPAADGALNTPTGAPSGLAQGSTVTLTGSGYAPNSTVNVYIYSTPTLLGTVVTDGSGSFSKAFTIPTTLAPGSHHLVAAGVDANGNPRYLVSSVTVAQGSGTLAWTGFETLPVLGVGVLVVALGAGLVVLGRRKRTAA